jgi:hypothetical protein
MNLVEQIRQQVVTRLFKTRSFNEVWRREWKKIILNHVVQNGTTKPKAIFDLGDQLSMIFSSTSDGRSQSNVSSAGTVWESLVCWYLNLCLIGTRGLVIKPLKDITPDPIVEAMTVTINGTPANTEADLIFLIFPDKQIYTEIYNDPILSNLKEYKNHINDAIQSDFSGFEIGIIQCKTNWNDNAQIPMLWNIIYSNADLLSKKSIKVGINGKHINHCHRFTYSFVTVPTTKKTTFRPNTLQVLRVKSLSGGNYWGKPTTSGVAESIKEIFNNNFHCLFDIIPIEQSIRKSLSNNRVPTYFNL